MWQRPQYRVTYALLLIVVAMEPHCSIEPDYIWYVQKAIYIRWAVMVTYRLFKDPTSSITAAFSHCDDSMAIVTTDEFGCSLDGRFR